jgi:hypothetical protein
MTGVNPTIEQPCAPPPLELTVEQTELAVDPLELAVDPLEVAVEPP